MTSHTIDDLPLDKIRYMIHHMFIPPQLPHGDDSSPDHERALVDITLDALQGFSAFATEDNNGAIGSVIRTVTTMNDTLDAEGTINEGKLSDALSNLSENGEYPRSYS